MIEYEGKDLPCYLKKTKQTSQIYEIMVFRHLERSYARNEITETDERRLIYFQFTSWREFLHCFAGKGNLSSAWQSP